KVKSKLRLVNGIAALVPKGQLKQLANDPSVKSIEPDVTLTAFDHGPDTGDLEYENAWGVEHIGTPAVHAEGVRGDGIKVAVIDTGVDYIHDDPDDTPFVVDPEFLNNYAGGYDFVNNDSDPMDDNGHGTHVAGILAAEKNGYLVSGVAPDVELYALKILNANGEGEESNLILALQWAIDNDIDVVNMSLGTHTNVAAMETAVANAHAAGLLLVAASGNINPLVWQEIFFGCPVAYPAAYPNVLSTTFTNPNNALTGWSCTGPEVDFGSPGDGILSPVPIGPCLLCAPQGYSAQSGTSMASPHLAGTVALMLDAGIADAGTPGLADDVRAQLCSTADVGFGVNSTPIPTNDPRYPNYFGCGILDADGAVLPLIPQGPNTPPVAVDETASTPEDAPVSVDVLANDSDADGDALHVESVSDPANGTATIDPSGTSVTYTPDADFVGLDSFTYVVADGNGGTDEGFVQVAVTEGNDPPVAVDDNATTAEDTPVSIPVLANDIDSDGPALFVASVGTAAHGTVAIDPSSTSVTYSPGADYNGPDSFTYVVDDGLGGTDTGTVSVTVTPTNDPPVAVDDSLTVAEDAGPTDVAVLANDTDVDGDPLSTTAVTDPPNGTASINPDGTVAYTPDPGFNGPDSFGYTVSDGAGGSDTGSVSVTVTAVDDPPTAAPKTASTTSPNPVTITLTGTDPDTCQLTFQVVDLPDHGGVGSLVGQACVAGSPNSDSATVVYTPTAGYSGPDAFTYRVLDATGASAPATVSITVNPAAGPQIHVGDLDGSTTSSGRNWKARVTIRVHSTTHVDVPGAVVTGAWSAGASGTGTCTTNASGVCTVQTGNLSKASVASATFTVTGVTLAGNAYAAGSNHDPDGGGGTTITVLRPT
ncbi:MAG TPA: Ig-like domain-containing protein, partial [Candidatus Limnocylindrales bacterium]|nr:Ig-like domain-containing protein [Candidatus Limnocylindrales bacterium]